MNTVWTFQLGTWTLNAIDIAVLVIVLLRGVVGAVRGFFSDFSHTAGLFGGALFGILFTSSLLDLFTSRFPNFPELWMSYFIFIGLVILGYIAFRLIGNTLDRLMEDFSMEALNTILGFFWGIVVSLFALSALVYLLSLQHIVDFSRYLDTSLFVTRIIQPLLPLSKDAIMGALNV
jgi:Colicin V production protein.